MLNKKAFLKCWYASTHGEVSSFFYLVLHDFIVTNPGIHAPVTIICLSAIGRAGESTKPQKKKKNPSLPMQTGDCYNDQWQITQ